jgi:hypothetical protein
MKTATEAVEFAVFSLGVGRRRAQRPVLHGAGQFDADRLRTAGKPQQRAPALTGSGLRFFDRASNGMMSMRFWFASRFAGRTRRDRS